MASKGLHVGGVGAQTSVDDVIKAAQGTPVILDTAGSERVKKSSPPPKSFVAEELGSSTESVDSAASVRLSPEHVRATLFIKLTQIMSGRSAVRLQVAEFIAALLNNQVIVQSASDSSAGDIGVLKHLVNACYGVGSAVIEGKATGLSDALSGVEPPKLSTSERLVVEGGAAATGGIGCFVVQAAKQLLSAATATSALTYEALGAQVKVLEAEVVEGQGSAAAAGVADEMRGLLEASKRVGVMKAAEAEALPAAVTAVPQRLGALAEHIAAAYSAVRAEVQSEALPAKGGAPGNVPSPRLASSLLSLASSLVSGAADAVARADRTAAAVADAAVKEQLSSLLSSANESVASAQAAVQAVGAKILGAAADAAAVARCGLSAALSADAAVKAMSQAVAVEAVTAVMQLRLLEGPPAPAAAADAPPEPAAGDDKKAKKKDRKGAGAGVVLGKGTAILRAAVEGLAAGSTTTLPVDGSALSLPTSCSSVQSAVLTPLQPGLSKLLEELKAVVEANQARRKPKVPKGARDFLPDQMAIREAAFGIITGVFKRHGAVSIDTPVFELRETLMGKYGEDSKLIYDLADQGGEVLSLRYDLTVPFARYVAVNGIGNIKRYHIGKVYRRDQPQMNRGRFREFFQCDFDIAGTYPTMVADAEVMAVLVEILTNLKLGEFEIKLNHRKLLDSMMEIAGVPPQKFRAICSAIDKLDKEPWEAVKSEMVNDKGLPEHVADKIGEFVVLRGEPVALIDRLCAADHPLGQHSDSRQALEDLKLLMSFLKAMNALGSIVLDLSLARGLDYYTGVIYEAVLKGSNVGSIAAGGRYDQLVGMFSGKDVPAVGVSIGIERVFAIMEAQVRERAAAEGKPVRATETQVLVASIGNNMQVKRMEIASRLWVAGIKAEFGFKANPKMGDQLNYALEEAIPFMVLFGDEELSAGTVKIKDMAAKTESVVPLDTLEADLKARIAAAAQA